MYQGCVCASTNRPPLISRTPSILVGKIVAAFEPRLLAAQKLERHDRGIVEADNEGRSDPLGFPERFHQIGALDRAIGVVERFVGIAMADILDIKPWRRCIAGQLLVDLGPAERAVGPARQKGCPDGTLWHGFSIRESPEDLDDICRTGVVARL